ncbi:MAG TPA: 4-hydroxy-tetrahydrodipicolinate reductase [Burkholderiales bacterium]|jgi:4-hydroxy-tetrahydrodipicolinate reductase|nr:4-hydroxy-tetrahydrodipicolinate reductase [Burkholderiales bacterium]
MGRTLVEGVLAHPELELAAALDLAAGEVLGRKVTTDVAAAMRAADVLIDFTRPDGTLAHVKACMEAGKAIVIGTTGFSDPQKKSIADAARRIPIAMSPNFAIGVNVVFKLAEMAAAALGDAYDVEIIEAHHRHKVDAPSGTALKLGEIIASSLKRDLGKEAKHGRQGDTGERPTRQIGFHAIRGGDIVGEHTVIFAGMGERVEVAVRSQSRMTYAAGALRAALWLEKRAPGLYDMADVLGLKRS